MGTMGVAWSERVDLGRVCQRAGQSSEGHVFPYCASAAPWCCEWCYFTHIIIIIIFLAGTLNVPKVFWQSPQVLQFPRLSQKQNNHGQVQIHTSVRLSQKHVVTQGGERPCGWMASPVWRSLQISPHACLPHVHPFSSLCCEKQGNSQNPLGLCWRVHFPV